MVFAPPLLDHLSEQRWRPADSPSGFIQTTSGGNSLKVRATRRRATISAKALPTFGSALLRIASHRSLRHSLVQVTEQRGAGELPEVRYPGRRAADSTEVKLSLVRHAMPAYRPDTPATAWKLSSEGWCQARALTQALPVGAVLIANREPKARQTLEPAGPTQTDEQFNEVTRDEPYEGDFRARRHAYAAGRVNSASMHRRHGPTEREGRPATACDRRPNPDAGSWRREARSIIGKWPWTTA